jgi:hypothetical protein
MRILRRALCLNFFMICVKVCPHVHNYEHEQAPMVTDLRRRPVMGFFTVALRPGESTDGQLGRDWAPPFATG